VATAGEYGTLNQSGGIFTYTDAAGTQYVFLANGKLSYYPGNYMKQYPALGRVRAE
jgi:hypothetical protein